jgi:homoserine kinase
MEKSIKAFAPATVANVSCAFDILGFALESPGDEVIIRNLGKSNTENTNITISKITGDGGVIPKDPKLNTATVGILGLAKHLNLNVELEVEIHKKMPLSSGLGSSAASGAAAIFAFNELMDLNLSKKELLEFALESEKIACGIAHADNIAPSLLGGFVLTRSYEPLDIIKLDTKVDLYAVAIHPKLEIRTEDARSILKKEIQLKIAIKQWGNIAGLITGLLTKDVDLISRSLDDYIIEPERAQLIPGFSSVKEAALKSNALGCGISGSGPSLFTLAKNKDDASAISQAMKEAFLEKEIESTCYISKVNQEGAKLL